MKKIFLILLMVFMPLIVYASNYEVTTPGNNVGIGSSAPGADLDVNGTLRVVGFSMGGNSTTQITGSGANVFANSPIFSGNVGIGSTAPGQSLDTPGTVRAGSFTTGNGVGSIVSTGGFTIDPTGSGSLIYASTGRNVGIGTSNPGVLFDTGAQIRSTNGSASAPSFVSGNYNNTGMFSGQPNGVSLSSNGTEVLTVVYGNVGIGSTAPGVALDVKGTVRITSGNVGIGTTISWPGQALVVNGTVRILGNLSGGVTGNVGIGTFFASATTCDSVCNTTNNRRCLFGLNDGVATASVVPCSSSITGDCLCLPQ